MSSLLYIYDIENLKSMQKSMQEFRFFSIAHFIHISGTIEKLVEMSVADVDNSIIDITNLIKDGAYYRVFTEGYILALAENFENVHFSLQSSFIDTFRERFPYLFDNNEINFDYQDKEKEEGIKGKPINMHPPLDIFTYSNQCTIKALYKEKSAMSLSGLMEECESISFRYNLENIKCTILENGTSYIDLSSIIRTLKLRQDLVFQFEIMVHHIASLNNVKFSLESGLVKEVFATFPLVFAQEQRIDDILDESNPIGENHKKIDIDKLNLFISAINENLKGHLAFKDDFKHNLLKFSFLNKMSERKILSILLCGDSGIGKTEFAKIASSIIYPNEPLIKINFGNYSNEGVLNSLIGSPLGYIGSEEGGELINKISTSKSRIILIDEFEKATPSIYNFFYELLEEGKFSDRHGIEHNLNGYIIIFTSNMTEKHYQKHIPNSLKSRFDMVYNFEDLTVEEKQEYINNTAIMLIEKLKKEFDVEVDAKVISAQLTELVKYKNLRDIKRKIEDIVFVEFFKHYNK